MDEPFNSSDIEFEPAPSKATTRRGKTSIAKMIEQAASSRVSSKKAVKQLQFGSGGPRNPHCSAAVGATFQCLSNFHAASINRQSFTGADVICFFDSIIGIVKPSVREQAGSKPHGGDQGIWDHSFLWNVSVQQEERIRADCAR